MIWGMDMDVLCGRVVSCCSLFWTMWMEGWTGTDVKRTLTSNAVMLSPACSLLPCSC